MNGHSEEYEYIMEAAGHEEPEPAVEPEWYVLEVDGLMHAIDTADALEQYALAQYSLTKDQFQKLTDGQPVRTSCGTDLQIVAADMEDDNDGE